MATIKSTVSTPPSIQKSPSPWQISMRKLVRNKLAMIGLAFIIIISTLSFLAPYITTQDPIKINIKEIKKAPSEAHILGTDSGGRDVYTRLLYGGRVSLTIGLSVTFLVVLFGTIIGSISGYYGGRIDSILMRTTDFFMNFPFLLFVIVLSSIFTGTILTLILVISFLGWTGTARLVRGKVLAEKENEYILAAISIGTSPAKVIFKHLLPNVISTVIVQATLLLAGFIVAEVGLSFLGFGVPANIPSWGNMLSEGRSLEVLGKRPWIWLPPGLAITLVILSINFLGEGLKDAFNPKSTR